MNDTTTAIGLPADSEPVAALKDEINVGRLAIERDLILAREKLEASQKLDALLVPQAPISWWLPVGMGAFGLMLGGVAGLSNAQGISQALLAGVSSFVGGVLLTYAGFKRTGSSTGAPDVDAGKVGAALFLFSIGVLISGLFFTALRFEVNANAALHALEAARKQTVADADRARTEAREDADRARREAREDAELARRWALEDAARGIKTAPITLSPTPHQPVPAHPSTSVAQVGMGFGMQNASLDVCNDVERNLQNGYGGSGAMDSAHLDLHHLLDDTCKTAPKRRVCSFRLAQFDGVAEATTAVHAAFAAVCSTP